MQTGYRDNVAPVVTWCLTFSRGYSPVELDRAAISRKESLSCG